MSKYEVDLAPVGDHAIPPLLEKFGAWLSSQENGSVGWFSLHTEAVPVEWDPDRIPRIQRDAFSFLELPDGSLLLLVNTGKGSPPAVALLGSEGETDAVATSLEEFLVLLSKGETGVSDLDEDDAPGRARLKTWLTKNKIKPSQAPPFDFDNFLDGSAKSSVPAVPQSSGSSPAESLKDLPPFVRQVALMVGRRADDPDLVEFVTGTLGQKVPTSTTSESKDVTAKKHGLELSFSHDVNNVKYPLIPKSKTSYVPYLSLVWLNPKLPDPLPFGLRFGMSVEEFTAKLGDPAVRGTLRLPYWERELDPSRDIVFQVDAKTFAVKIKGSRVLTQAESRPVVGLLTAWLAVRGFLEPKAFPGHEALLEAVRLRKERGSKLAETALPRGLWDIHLKDLPGLRDFAYGWMHRLGDSWIRNDLVGVFGSRKGPHGLDEAAIDDDDWQTVDKAAPVLDQRFAKWKPGAV